jgi:WD40 repeat protein/serine/threonine protein kinase
MTTWNPRANDLFLKALELGSAGERQQYLDAMCGPDAALRAEVESLLEASARAGRFLESAAPALPRNATVAESLVTECPGTVIGPYKLLEQIGEGGFGVVFMAEQQHPVRRKVAVKIIKPGMDTRRVIARFEAERQALALMDHPNIARVLDAGATESGRPYFVMELVRGVPITQFCDDNRLAPHERLELFVDVCRAVQHAHQKGIIHRDLKPSNVLVTLHDGIAVVKVIDFGIAKSLGHERLTDKTLFTSFACMIGTPLYMSPEQAEMSGQDVDTRTDIYSLGVLLYELLTGTTPIDKERLKEASYDEIRRIIREEEPAKPSTRISTLGQAATTVSANRKSEPRRLSQLFRRELDWIVMKALEKDRNRRYDTASSFAADVESYLHDEPVQAYPPSAGYRLRKFARRNKVALITASAIGVVVLLAVTGLAISTTLIWQTNQELRLERGRAEEKTKEARRLLYSSDLIAAHQAWEDGHLARAGELLDRQRPHEDEEDLRGFEWRYLWRLCRDGSLHTFSGYTAQVLAVNFAPDGRMLASASPDGSVRLWDVATRRPILSLEGFEGQVGSLAFTPDGALLAIASNNGRIHLWDVASRRQVASLPDTVRGKEIAITPDGKLLASAGYESGPIKLWDIPTRSQRASLPGSGPWQCVAISPDGRILAASKKDTTVRLWDLVTRQETGVLPGHRAHVTCLAFSPNGKMLAACDHDGTIKLWDPATQQEWKTLRGQTASYYSVAFSPDGKTLITGGADSLIQLWDTATWQIVRTLRGHTAWILAVAVSPNGRILASGSDDGTVKLWDLAAKLDPEVLPGHEAWAYRVEFSPDGRMLASGGTFDHLVKLWDVATGRQLATLPGHQDSVLAVKFTADSKTLVSGGSDNTIRLWDIAGERQGVSLPVRQVAQFEHTGAVDCVAVSPDGRMLAAGSLGGTVILWEIATRREKDRFDGKLPVFNPEGNTLAVGLPDGTAGLFDVRTGQVVATLPAEWPSRTQKRFRDHANIFQSGAVSPDGRYLAFSAERTINLWDLAARQWIACLKGHTNNIWSVAFSPDSKTLASCSQDGTVKLWNLHVLQEAVTLRSHGGQVATLAFAPDGNLLATSGSDGKIRLWRASSWEQTDPIVENHTAVAEPERWFVPQEGEGLLTDWLILAPIPLGDPKRLINDVDERQIQGEVNLQPKVGQSVRVAGKDLFWREHHASILDFHAFLGKETVRSLAYAVCYIVSDQERRNLRLFVRSDDQSKIYLNGTEVYRYRSRRTLVADQHPVDGITLKQGTNTLVFKVVNELREWKGSVRIVHPDGSLIPGLRVGQAK